MRREDARELSPRERQVLNLVAQGYLYREVATELFIAEVTVQRHMERVLLKLGVRDRNQAVIEALIRNLLRVTPDGIVPTY